VGVQAVQVDSRALLAHLGEQALRLLCHEPEMGVLLRRGVVDEPHLDVVVGGAVPWLPLVVPDPA
jgi:hypothetical protein